MGVPAHLFIPEWEDKECQHRLCLQYCPQAVPGSTRSPWRCFIDHRWLPYKEAAPMPCLTDEETKVLFAMDLPRVTQPSAVPSAVDTQSLLHTFLDSRPSLYPGQPSLLALPQLPHPDKTRENHLAAAGLAAPQRGQGASPGVLDLSHPTTLRS